MDEWKIVKRVSSKRRLGDVWEVTTKNKSKQGFFKHVNKSSEGSSGPLAANEYIAYLLGKEVGLPIATIEVTNVDGILGVVSQRMTDRKVYNWNTIKDLDNPFEHVRNPEKLISMFVFDCWILNIDRNNRNIILYRNDNENKGNNKNNKNNRNSYDFYLIDHGLSLLGALAWKKKRWNQTYWLHVANYNRRYLTGLSSFIKKNEQILFESTKDLQQISTKRIEEIIKKTPSAVLPSSQRDIVISLLCTRKEQLQDIMEYWLRDIDNS